jgi:hypothetical protein
VSTFASRQLQFTIALGGDTGTGQQGTFAAGGTTLVLPSLLRASARIRNPGAPQASEAEVVIFGLQPSLMQQLNTLGMELSIVPRNSIFIAAGDFNSGFSTVFQGNIIAAAPDYSAAPNVPLVIRAQAGLTLATLPANVMSFQGTVTAATIFGSLAQKMNLTLENAGVNATLRNPWFRGSLTSQMLQAAEAMGVTAEIDKGKLVIKPKFQPRQGAQPVLIAPPPEGSMIGYPSFAGPLWIMARTVFDPAITWMGLVTIKSSVLSGFTPNENAPGGNLNARTWLVNQLDLALDSNVPKGQWMATVYGYLPGAGPVLPPAR